MEAIAQAIKGQDIQDGDAVYSLVKSLTNGGALEVFQNKEESQEIKDSTAFSKCFAAVTEHVFPKKAYKTQKKYIQNILPFPVTDGVTATKISCEEFVDDLEERILYQWKLEFKKE
eukprot:3639510-Ditylum_brightwellii.AAC.1